MSLKFKNINRILQLNFFHAANTQINILFTVKKEKRKTKENISKMML